MKLLSNQQRLHLVNTEQLFDNYRIALSHAKSYTYGMRWKTVRDTEYLFRDKDRHGNGKSLGRRTPETQALLSAFSAGRSVAQERLRLITEKLVEQARLNKALRLNRVPRVVARILRELDQAGLHDSFTVIGTQALYAYEAAAGAHFLLELLASGDVDLLYDNRHKMTVVSEKLDGNGLLGLLKKADKTFQCIREDGYRAANAGQFMVDLVIAPRGRRNRCLLDRPVAWCGEKSGCAGHPEQQSLSRRGRTRDGISPGAARTSAPSQDRRSQRRQWHHRKYFFAGIVLNCVSGRSKKIIFLPETLIAGIASTPRFQPDPGALRRGKDTRPSKECNDALLDACLHHY